jgi:hypothetical protein
MNEASVIGYLCIAACSFGFPLTVAKITTAARPQRRTLRIHKDLLDQAIRLNDPQCSWSRADVWRLPSCRRLNPHQFTGAFDQLLTDRVLKRVGHDAGPDLYQLDPTGPAEARQRYNDALAWYQDAMVSYGHAVAASGEMILTVFGGPTRTAPFGPISVRSNGAVTAWAGPAMMIRFAGQDDAV